MVPATVVRMAMMNWMTFLTVDQFTFFIISHRIKGLIILVTQISQITQIDFQKFVWWRQKQIKLHSCWLRAMLYRISPLPLCLRASSRTMQQPHYGFVPKLSHHGGKNHRPSDSKTDVSNAQLFLWSMAERCFFLGWCLLLRSNKWWGLFRHFYKRKLIINTK